MDDKERLAQALEDVGVPQLRNMILSARGGVYHGAFKTIPGAELARLALDTFRAGYRSHLTGLGIVPECDTAYQKFEAARRAVIAGEYHGGQGAPYAGFGNIILNTPAVTDDTADIPLDELTYRTLPKTEMTFRSAEKDVKEVSKWRWPKTFWWRVLRLVIKKLRFPYDPNAKGII